MDFDLMASLDQIILTRKKRTEQKIALSHLCAKLLNKFNRKVTKKRVWIKKVQAHRNIFLDHPHYHIEFEKFKKQRILVDKITQKAYASF